MIYYVYVFYFPICHHPAMVFHIQLWMLVCVCVVFAACLSFVEKCCEVCIHLLVNLQKCFPTVISALLNDPLLLSCPCTFFVNIQIFLFHPFFFFCPWLKGRVNINHIRNLLLEPQYNFKTTHSYEWGRGSEELGEAMRDPSEIAFENFAFFLV